MITDAKKPKTGFPGETNLRAGAGTTLALPALFHFLQCGGLLLNPLFPVHEADEWFNKVKGKHRIVYDVNWGPTMVFGGSVGLSFIIRRIMPPEVPTLIWRQWWCCDQRPPFPLAMDDKLWEKYKFWRNVFKSLTQPPARPGRQKTSFAITSQPMWTMNGYRRD